MDELKDLTYGVVGLGIMGGSIAKSIRANVLSLAGARGRILACNRSAQCLGMALDGGVIDGAFRADGVDEMLPQCDLVFVCLYPRATLDFMAEHRQAFKPCAVVTDISGVKRVIVDNVRGALRDDIDFVVGHPMAGGAKEGYVNSRGEYFVGRNYILVPQSWNTGEHLALMRQLIGAMGFSRIVETTAGNHDRKVAFTSQLCHVIASALVKTADDASITEFGGGSFEDLTRIAMINAPLWTELFLEDKDELLAHIDRFSAQMAAIRVMIASGDSDGLAAYLSDVRRRRIDMGTIVSRG